MKKDVEKEVFNKQKRQNATPTMINPHQAQAESIKM